MGDDVALRIVIEDDPAGNPSAPTSGRTALSPAASARAEGERAAAAQQSRGIGGGGAAGKEDAQQSRGIGGAAGKEPDFLGAIANYSMRSLMAQMSPLSRMLIEEAKKGMGSGRSGSGGSGGSGGGDGGGYRAGGIPQPVFVENWPGQLHVYVDNLPSAKAEGERAAQQPSTLSTKSAGDDAAEGAEAGEGAEAAEGVEAAGAAGPAAPVVLGAVLAYEAANKAGKELAGAVNFTVGGVKALGSAASDLARGEHFQSLAGLSDKAASALGEIPVVGAPLKATLLGMTGSMGSFKDVVESFVARGRQLAQYSEALSASQTRSEVRSLMGDLREKDALGEQLAQLEDSYSQLTAELRDMLLPIKGVIIQELVVFLDGTREFLQKLEVWIAGLDVGMREGFTAVVEALSLHLGTAQEIIKKMPEDVASAMNRKVQEQEARKKADFNGLLDEQLKQLYQNFDKIPGAMPNNPAGRQGLGIPLFES